MDVFVTRIMMILNSDLIVETRVEIVVLVIPPVRPPVLAKLQVPLLLLTPAHGDHDHHHHHHHAAEGVHHRTGNHLLTTGLVLCLVI